MEPPFALVQVGGSVSVLLALVGVVGKEWLVGTVQAGRVMQSGGVGKSVGVVKQRARRARGRAG